MAQGFKKWNNKSNQHCVKYARIRVSSEIVQVLVLHLNPGILLLSFSLSFSFISALVFALPPVTYQGIDTKSLALYLVFCWVAILYKYRCCCSQMFFKIGILKNFTILTGKHLRWSLFLIKLQVWGPSTLLKRDSSTGDFLWILHNFLEQLFYRTSAMAAFVIALPPIDAWHHQALSVCLSQSNVQCQPLARPSRPVGLV